MRRFDYWSGTKILHTTGRLNLHAIVGENLWLQQRPNAAKNKFKKNFKEKSEENYVSSHLRIIYKEEQGKPRGAEVGK